MGARSGRAIVLAVAAGAVLGGWLGSASAVAAIPVPVPDPPRTSIGPDAPRIVKNRTPTFELISSQPRSTFECSLDDGPFEPCTSPFTTPLLADGEHLLQVLAVNAAGDFDVPARWAFVVDTRGPDVDVVRPALGEGFPQGAVVSPVYTCSEPFGVAVVSCTAPDPIDTSTIGPKMFVVTAIDALGNVHEKPIAYLVDEVRPPGGGGTPPGGATAPGGGGDRTVTPDRTGDGGRSQDRGDGSTGAPAIAQPARPVRVGPRGIASVATVTCRAPRPCGVRVPRNVTVTIGGVRHRVAVLAPRRLARGARAAVRLRLPRAARAQLAGRRTVARVRIVLSAPGQPSSPRTVSVTLTRPTA